MGVSSTIIAALKYQGGVVIAADSQASDPNASVKWPIQKLYNKPNRPLVVGFSGSVGMLQRAYKQLEDEQFHKNMFKKRGLIQNALDRCFGPIYKTIDAKNVPKVPGLWELTIWGLEVF